MSIMSVCFLNQNWFLDTLVFFRIPCFETSFMKSVSGKTLLL